MALNFPNSPTTGQTFSPAGGYRYVYQGGAWQIVAGSPAIGVVQIVNTASSSVLTLGAIPLDDTIPQISEGTEIFTCAITPKSSTNKLKIEVVVYQANSAAGNNIMALFQDATANALAAVTAVSASSTYATCMNIVYHMIAGTTSATTFRVRGGSNTGTSTVNGASGGRLFGGVYASSITITEYTP